MNRQDLKFFNPYGDIRRWQTALPHWQQKGAVYFVTFRLWDSLPTTLTNRWRFEKATWLECHPKPWSPETELEYDKRFTRRWEQELDRSHGACILRRPECATIVGRALTHFEGERCHQLAWVVMPTHVHALFVLNAEVPLEQLLHSWKSFTATQINRLTGNAGPFWQHDYFDRIVRDGDHYQRCVRYIRRNPERAEVRAGEFLAWESAMAGEVV